MFERTIPQKLLEWTSKSFRKGVSPVGISLGEAGNFFHQEWILSCCLENYYFDNIIWVNQFGDFPSEQSDKDLLKRYCKINNFLGIWRLIYGVLWSGSLQISSEWCSQFASSIKGLFFIQASIKMSEGKKGVWRAERVSERWCGADAAWRRLARSRPFPSSSDERIWRCSRLKWWIDGYITHWFYWISVVNSVQKGNFRVSSSDKKQRLFCYFDNIIWVNQFGDFPSEQSDKDLLKRYCQTNSWIPLFYLDGGRGTGSFIHGAVISMMRRKTNGQITSRVLGKNWDFLRTSSSAWRLFRKSQGRAMSRPIHSLSCQPAPVFRDPWRESRNEFFQIKKKPPAFWAEGFWVEAGGIEPATSALRTLRSPNWATPPTKELFLKQVGPLVDFINKVKK